MGFWENFPYTNFHEMNLNWILGATGKVLDDIKTVAENVEASAENVEASAAYAEKSKTYLEKAKAYADIAQASVGLGRRFILVGDSYLVGYTPDGDVESWGAIFRRLTGLTEHSAYIFAEGSAGFTKRGTYGHTFQTLVEDNYGVVENPETITDIIVLGGFNDFQSPTAIDGSVELFVDSAKRLFPACKVSIGFIARHCGTDNALANNLYTVYYNYKMNSHCAYINGIEYCCRNIGQFSSDGFHPNRDGQEAIALGLLDYVTGGSPRNWLAPFTATGVQIVNYTTVEGETLTIDVTGGIYTLEILNGNNLDGAIVDLGLVTGGAFCTTVLNAAFATTCFCYTASGWIPGNISFSVNNERHLIATFLVKGNDTISVNGHVQVPQTSCTFPTMRC